jgi:hypothetical protein
MLYQLPIPFLACKSFLPQGMKNYFAVPTWKTILRNPDLVKKI